MANCRIGDLAGAAKSELAVGASTAAPAQTAQCGWVSGQLEPFGLAHDAGLDSVTSVRGDCMVRFVPATAFSEPLPRGSPGAPGAATHLTCASGAC